MGNSQEWWHRHPGDRELWVPARGCDRSVTSHPLGFSRDPSFPAPVGCIPWLCQSFLHLILEAFLRANNSSPATAPPGDKSQRCHLQWHEKEADQADPARLQGLPHSKHPWLKHLSTDPKNQ